MSTHLLRPRRVLPVAAVALMTMFAAASAHAAPNRIGADVRVVDDAGKTLVDQRQYTGTTKIETSRKANCFGKGTGGSGDAAKVPGTTALGIVADASEYARQLRPLSITDSFDFGLGVCGFGHAIAPSTGYWYLKKNHVGSQTGGDQTAVERGDDILWYLIDDYNDPYPAELAIKAPAEVKPGHKIRVKVSEYADNGKKTPAAGAKIVGTGVTTDASGKATVPIQGATTRLRAVRVGAIPSPAVDVCEQLKLSDCPNGHPLEIDGTDGADHIRSDKRPTVINAYRGRDVVNLKPSTNAAPPIVKCGPGKDVVKVRHHQKFTARHSCERIKHG